MSRYELWVFLHVASVIVWIGAGTTLALIAFYAQRTRDRLLLERLAGLNGWLGQSPTWSPSRPAPTPAPSGPAAHSSGSQPLLPLGSPPPAASRKSSDDEDAAIRALRLIARQLSGELRLGINSADRALGQPSALGGRRVRRLPGSCARGGSRIR